MKHLSSRLYSGLAEADLQRPKVKQEVFGPRSQLSDVKHSLVPGAAILNAKSALWANDFHLCDMMEDTKKPTLIFKIELMLLQKIL